MIRAGVASARKGDRRDKETPLSMCPPQRQVQSRQRLPTTRQLASFKTPRHVLHASWPTRTRKPSACKHRVCKSKSASSPTPGKSAKVRGWSECRQRLCLPTPGKSAKVRGWSERRQRVFSLTPGYKHSKSGSRLRRSTKISSMLPGHKRGRYWRKQVWQRMATYCRCRRRVGEHRWPSSFWESLRRPRITSQPRAALEGAGSGMCTR
mmetsp:Transcript_66077/g.107213  ORF Transcript_66077/g.107213 Transcript_66077/m.107213 type:complete len:208 (-) Transcript_66077:179-802(-)